MKVLKTAVTGLGRIGWQYHIPAIIKHKGFNLICVVDPLINRLNEARNEFSVKGYTDLNQMLDNEKIDLLVVSSPTIFHREQAITAMERGVDVFLEKPMAFDLDEADKIINVMKTNNRKLMVYQPHRVTAEIQALKSILNRGIIGPVYMIKRGCSNYFRCNDWQSLVKYGGGMLNNYGAHFIDQLLYTAGSQAKRITCHLNRIASLGDADDVVKILIQTNNGITLDLDINMATAVTFPEWIVMGAFGTISYESTDDGGIFHVCYYKQTELDELTLNPQLAADKRSYNNFEEIPWRKEKVFVSDFNELEFYDKNYAYYALDNEPFVPIQETREVMRLIHECKKEAGGMYTGSEMVEHISKDGVVD